MELQVRADDLSPEQVQALTEELAGELQREAGVRAELPREQAEAGARGDPITIGLLLLAAVKSGAASALFGTVTAFLHRSKKLEIELKRPDGESITLRSENVSEEERDRTLRRLREMLED